MSIMYVKMAALTMLLALTLGAVIGCDRKPAAEQDPSANEWQGGTAGAADPIRALRRLNAEVVVNRDPSGKPIVALDLTLVGELTQALEQATTLPGVQRINLQGLQLAARHFELLRRFPSLRWINLANTNITDADMAFLESTPNVEFLLLWNTAVSDAGLHAVAQLAPLRKLDLSASRVRGPGLQELASLRQLQELYVEIPGIDTARIDWLREQLPHALIVH